MVYAEQGQYEKSAELTRQELRLNPDNVAPYDNLANSYLALQRFDDARKTIREAQARKLDDYITRNAVYALAFLASDSVAMADQQRWFTGKPEENYGLSLRLRHRGVCRALGQGTRTDQAVCRLRHSR